MPSERLSVSIIIPCRNEKEYIGRCLDSVIANDFPKKDLEILVIDGDSDDGTLEILEKYTKENSIIKVIHNHRKIKPVAFNLGIQNAKGDIVMIMGAHTIYAFDYISKCIKYLDKYEADNVGGVRETRVESTSVISKSIALAISHPFAAGNASYRTGSEDTKWVDTVFGGCWHKAIFDEICKSNGL